MQIEHVARVSFASWRTAEQQRDLTIGPSLLRQVVIHDQRILTTIAEIFAHRSASIRSEVLHGCRLGSRRSNNNGVIHCTVLFELGYDIRNRRGLLTDSYVHADQIFAFLIDNRVDRNGSLAGLAVADDQFTLTAANRHHRVDGLKTSLNRL